MESLSTIHLSTDTPVAEASHHIFTALQTAGFFSTASPVLIISGGSSIAVAKALLESLPSAVQPMKVLLADERFVPITDQDSNYQQLKTAGVIELIQNKGGTFLPLYTGEQSQGTDAATAADQVYEEALQQATMVALLAGVGPDGHTLGMLPTNSAETFSYLFADSNYVTYYEVDPQDSSNPFTKRITTTLRVVAKTDFVFIYAYGKDKGPALQALKEKNKPLHALPALGLYLSQQPVVLLTDQEV